MTSDSKQNGLPATADQEKTTSSESDKEEDESMLVHLMNQQKLVVSETTAEESENGVSNNNEMSSPSLRQLQQQAILNAVMKKKNVHADASKDEEDKKKVHAFWDTQPMSASTSPDSPHQHCPIIPNKPPSELRATPYNMPRGFEWSDIVITDPTQRSEVYTLLANNYVEDDDCMFRFDYSIDFLMWALTPPGYRNDFHLGVRSSSSGRLMAFITGVPAKVRAYEKVVDMVEINFLCVHKKLRSKRLAPVLIKEITRRVNHTGVFQAVYTAGVVLPVPVASCRYYHRSLDPKKLVEIKFSRLHPRMTMARMQKLYRLPNETSTNGLRVMEDKDVIGAHKLLVKHLEKYELAVVFSEEEFRHWLMPRDRVISTYVATNDAGEVTDMCSFYYLPSTIIGHPKHSHLMAAYSFYNVATSVPLPNLMRDSLILAKRAGHDVFNALNQMDNESFLEELKFGVGDGNLQYYLYNWACPVMDARDVGIVLL